MEGLKDKVIVFASAGGAAERKSVRSIQTMRDEVVRFTALAEAA
ncbi:hypothetical protein ABZU75_12300 [Streptosporangium sp. NPDC005286]